jgi:uncharacterized delta-60 repeat protein
MATKTSRRRIFFFLITITALVTSAGLSCTPEGPVEVLWSKTYDSGTDDAAHAITVDASGNVYVGGSSKNGIYNDFRTLKYDSTGNIIWDKAYDSSNNDEVLGLVVSSTGDVYVTGASVESNENCIRLIKYDASGNLLWNKELMNNAYAYDMTTDASGNLYIAGRKVNTTSADFTLIKTDAEGNIIWSKIYEAADNEQAHGVALDNTGNIYVTGFSMPPGSDSDILTLKYSPDGTLLWSKTYDSGFDDAVYGHGIAADPNGNVYVAGYTTVTTPAGEYVIIKYNSNGDTLWTKTYAADNTDPTASIAINATGSVYLLGTYLSTDNYDFMIAEYDSKGILSWDTLYDSGQDDFGTDIALDANGNILATGRTAGTDSGPDFLTVKLKP